MYDIIKSRAYYGEIKAGTLLRATGDGSKMIRVREITGPETCTVESYGRLTYGNIKFAETMHIRPAHIHRYTMEHGRTKGRHEAIVEVQTHRNSWHKSWGYIPVEIYSKMVSVQDAYELGQRSAKAAHKHCQRWRLGDLAFIQGGLNDAHDWRLSNGPPWPQIAELCAAWCFGFNSIRIPSAASYERKRIERQAKLPWNRNI